MTEIDDQLNLDIALRRVEHTLSHMPFGHVMHQPMGSKVDTVQRVDAIQHNLDRLRLELGKQADHMDELETFRSSIRGAARGVRTFIDLLGGD